MLAFATSMRRTLRAALIGVQTSCALCVIGMSAAVAYEILARTVLGEPTVWAQEISIYLLIAVAFLGLAPTLASDEHIRIDVFTRRLGSRVRRALGAAAMLGIAAYAAVAAYGGVEIVLHSMRFGRRSLTLLSVPVWIPQALVPVGMSLLCLVALAGFWALLKGEEPPGTSG
jgi:TRAP-type C4-dicarboxylate transport system permease small subunit